MLVDLARNDLSKNSEFVNVDTYAEIQYFSHVIHMVSRVSGRLFKDVKGLDIYADTFPAGTLSGAPKYRALQIIDETENISRNFYGGAIGFLGFDGSINHAIIIRSILSKNNVLTYQAGAGIVADSTPDGELQEVNNKVAALRKAIDKSRRNMKLLVLDNYDSFTYNLVYILRQNEVDFEVYRNDKISPELALKYDGILLSPGPGIPNEAGNMPAIIKQCAGKIPILGICLGTSGIG